jgi:hypothetical protein
MTLFQKLTVSIFVLAILTCSKAFTQPIDMTTQEDKYVKLYAKIESFASRNYNSDSISFYSDRFEAEFTSFIVNNPTSLNYSFKNLNDNHFCHIITSSDGNFRIYSWDTRTGGTAAIFRTFYQWRSNGKIFTKVPTNILGDLGRFCSKIFTVNINSKNHYLALEIGIYSKKYVTEFISAYCIEDNNLVDTLKVFKTKKGKLLNSIHVDYDFSSVYNRPERPIELIAYDDKQKIIYIPKVDVNGKVQTENILYQLNGRYLKYIGIETGMRK